MESLHCTNQEQCKYAPNCREDLHHLYWPRKDYKTDVEREFRNLEENVIRGICRALHEEIHAEIPPPEKPSRDEMLRGINDVA